MRDAVLGYLAVQRGRAAGAHQLLTRAWTSLGDPAADPELAARICQRMVLHSLARLRGDRTRRMGRPRHHSGSRNTPAAVESAAVRGLGLAMTGRVDEAVFVVRDTVRPRAARRPRQRVRMAEG